MTLRFTLNVVPPKATAQGKGVMVIGGKPRFFTKGKQKGDNVFLAGVMAPYVPDTPFTAPIEVMIVWVFPWRKSEKKSALMWDLKPHSVTPDLDNLEKSLLDNMTRLGFWTDDSLIARKVTEKYWGENPRIEIQISPWSSYKTAYMEHVCGK